MYVERDRPGAVIAGKYELLELAGRGGMATVWRAVTLGAAGFRRPVAVKRILSTLIGSRDFVTLFVEEARVCADLSHPNIVQTHDFGRDEQGMYYLVLEWVEGLDMRRFLYAYEASGLRVPWPILTAITIEVLRALGAAHERIDGRGRPAPVFHRDVNPQNILLGLHGAVKLTDFGLARAMDRARITHPDILKGKLSYMAPEMAFGHPASVQSDLFSVGVVLWETLVGRKLFEGADDVEVVLGVRRAEIPALSSMRKDLPPPFSRIVERSLAREPKDRYASARQMGRELAGLLRRVAEPTDAQVVGQSVAEARRRLQRLPPVPPETPLVG
ncbi:MAG: serine/threonine protein kinase [Deltaproteobacteria bacterium]|nr:serine/threonine protein kinase [Deltaproteobacteria bacterium]